MDYEDIEIIEHRGKGKFGCFLDGEFYTLSELVEMPDFDGYYGAGVELKISEIGNRFREGLFPLPFARFVKRNVCKEE